MAVAILCRAKNCGHKRSFLTICELSIKASLGVSGFSATMTAETLLNGEI